MSFAGQSIAITGASSGLGLELAREFAVQGARVALPIWIDFMKTYIGDQETPPGFVPPGNVIFTSVIPKTGEVAEPWARGAIQEVFISGTEPGTAFRR